MGLFVPPLVGGPGRSGRLPSIFDASCDMLSSFVSSDMPMLGVPKFGIRAMVRILMLIYSPANKNEKKMLFIYLFEKRVIKSKLNRIIEAKIVERINKSKPNHIDCK